MRKIMAKQANFKWTVEFSVDPVWVADGFEIDDGRAKAMIEAALPWATEHETSARVLKSPDQKRVLTVQGFTKR